MPGPFCGALSQTGSPKPNRIKFPSPRMNELHRFTKCTQSCHHWVRSVNGKRFAWPFKGVYEGSKGEVDESHDSRVAVDTTRQAGHPLRQSWQYAARGGCTPSYVRDNEQKYDAASSRMREQQMK